MIPSILDSLRTQRSSDLLRINNPPSQINPPPPLFSASGGRGLRIHASSQIKCWFSNLVIGSQENWKIICTPGAYPIYRRRMLVYTPKMWWEPCGTLILCGDDSHNSKLSPRTITFSAELLPSVNYRDGKKFRPPPKMYLKQNTS